MRARDQNTASGSIAFALALVKDYWGRLLSCGRIAGFRRSGLAGISGEDVA
jgi:hypothetical protein